MTDYEKTLELWRRKNVQSDVELAEALNGYGISFAYHSGKIENGRVTYHDVREVSIRRAALSQGISMTHGAIRSPLPMQAAKP